MPDLDEFALAKLAREMAMNIRPALTVFEDFGITPEDYYILEKNEFFKRAKEQFSLEWNSALSVNERVKLISAAFLEEALPKLGKRMMGDEPLPAATEVAKLFARNAGLGEGKGEQKSAERFSIVITIGEESKTYDKALIPEANTIDLIPTSAQKL